MLFPNGIGNDESTWGEKLYLWGWFMGGVYAADMCLWKWDVREAVGQTWRASLTSRLLLKPSPQQILEAHPHPLWAEVKCQWSASNLLHPGPDWDLNGGFCRGSSCFCHMLFPSPPQTLQEPRWTKEAKKDEKNYGWVFCTGGTQTWTLIESPWV